MINHLLYILQLESVIHVLMLLYNYTAPTYTTSNVKSLILLGIEILCFDILYCHVEADTIFTSIYIERKCSRGVQRL